MTPCFIAPRQMTAWSWSGSVKPMDMTLRSPVVTGSSFSSSA